MNYTKILNDMTWSFSRLHTWEQCPYAFYLKYIEQRPGESNYYAENGKCIHEVFQTILTNQIPLEECTTLYSHKYDLICEKTRQSIMDNTYETCMDYLSVIDGIEKEKYQILGVELELPFKIGNYKFIGYADLVVKNKENEKILLIDHKQAPHFLKKDGTPLKSQITQFTAYKHQMYLYCKGLKECFDIQVDHLIWHHFKDQGKLTILPFAKEDYEGTLKWAVTCIQNIQKDRRFKHHPSFLLCSSLCDYRNDCEYQNEDG